MNFVDGYALDRLHNLLHLKTIELKINFHTIIQKVQVF